MTGVHIGITPPVDAPDDAREVVEAAARDVEAANVEYLQRGGDPTLVKLAAMWAARHALQEAGR